MKFIIYKDQKKITVDNVTIPNQFLAEEMSLLDPNKEITLEDPELYKLRITAMSNLLDEEDGEDDESIQSIDGINWHQVTVN
jgi:hypothetical protein